MQKIEIIGAAAFPGAVRHGVVLVNFSADWCGYCVTQDRVIDQMAVNDRFPVTVRIAQVSVDEAPLIVEKLGVEAIPAQILFHNGVEVRRHIGVADEEELLHLLQ